MKTYRFYKNDIGWFIDLPKWPFSIGYLAMVGGADTWLDMVSNNTNEVKLKISTKKFEYAEVIKRDKVLYLGWYGAFYIAKMFKEVKLDEPHLLWLCPVTLWVFLRYPKNIYYEKV